MYQDPQSMTREEAIAIASRVAETNGWTWLEPVRGILRTPFFRRPRWEILSNFECRGCNVFVSIDDATKSVIRSAFLPR